MVAAFAAGVFFGVVFFGGLYWSVRRLHKFRNPGLWMVASLVLRMMALLYGFYLLSDKGMKAMAAALTGAMLVKFFLIFLSTSGRGKSRGGFK